MNNMKKYFFMCMGFLFLGIGILGYILPGLPGTIFLIIATSFFMKSNEKMYNWVINNPRFGKFVKKYLETNEIPKKIKIIAICSIIVFTSISMLYSGYGILFKVPVLIVSIWGIWFILSKKTG